MNLYFRNCTRGPRAGPSRILPYFILLAACALRATASQEIDIGVTGDADHPTSFNFIDLRAREYALINRFDINTFANVTELYEIGKTEPVHVWVFNEYEKFVFTPVGRFAEKVTPGDPDTLRVRHPWLGIDGALTFHQNITPLYQIDTCKEVVWSNSDFGYHHSLQPDREGNFWVPGIPHEHDLHESYGDKFKDDHIVQVSPEGETLYSKSVVRILEENNLGNRIYTYDRAEYDPIHINDIEPVKEDGPYWKRGDVFISLGHLNMIMLFRPSEDKLEWWSQDDIMHQHDIDVLDDHRISVFDNRRTDRDSGPLVLEHNEIRIIDFETGQSSTPWSESLGRLGVQTVSQGLADFDEAGGVLVEETNFGRIIKLSRDGNVEWEFINARNDEGIPGRLNWGRLINGETGEAIKDSLDRRNCDS